MGSSEVGLEGGTRFGSALALPASRGVDGASGRPFKGVTLVWIDVELTGAVCSWPDDDGEGVALRIELGPFLAPSPWGLIGGRLSSGELFWCFGDLVKAAPGGGTKRLVREAGFWPVLARFRFFFSSGWVPMTATSSDNFFSVLWFQLCVVVYGFYLRLISFCWMFCYLHAVAIDLLLWGWAHGDDPAEVLLMVSGRGSAGRRGFGLPRLSLFLSAINIIYYYFVVVVISRCALFPTSPCPHGLRNNGFNLGCYTLRV